MIFSLSIVFTQTTTTYSTYKNPYSNTTTTTGSDGSTLNSYKNPYSNTTTTTVTQPKKTSNWWD